MAPPPKYVITRKLIKRYFKRFLPRAAEPSKAHIDELRDCWGKHGIGSEKCFPIIDMLDSAYTRAMRTKNNYKKLDIEAQVMSSLRKPIYPFQRKGRYRDLPARHRDIYDGIF
jgi:hypothetical protein